MSRTTSSSSSKLNKGNNGFTVAQRNEIISICKEVFKEEMKNFKGSNSNGKKAKEVPAFSTLLAPKKEGSSYIVAKNPDKQIKAWGFYMESAKKFNGSYEKWNADTQKGGFWSFKKKGDAQSFFDDRKADYEKWATDNGYTIKA